MVTLKVSEPRLLQDIEIFHFNLLIFRPLYRSLSGCEDSFSTRKTKSVETFKPGYWI